MEDNQLRRIMVGVILAGLIVMSFFILRPILLSIVMALILAFIFHPLYQWTLCKIKSKNLAAALICFLLILIIILPFWFLTPIVIKQSLKIYVESQQIDFVTPLKTIFPDLLASEEFSAEIGSIISSFITKTTNYLMNTLSNLILNFPTIFLQLLVVFFTFFFALRDQERLTGYIKSLLPFSKEVEKRLFESSKNITVAVIYGQVIIGLIQGVIVGIGFFLFGVPNALFLTLLAALAGIFPIIGTTIIWIPVAIYLLIADNTFQTFGVVVFGLLSSSVDNLLRPIIVSQRTRMHSAIILIGMIGGLFLFGVLGFILGPLIIAYLLIILELYRNKKSPSLFTKEVCK